MIQLDSYPSDYLQKNVLLFTENGICKHLYIRAFSGAKHIFYIFNKVSDFHSFGH